MAQIEIHPVAPDNYNPSAQIMSWGDIMPKFSLPSNKMLMLKKGNVWNPEQLFERGLTHLSNLESAGVPGAEWQGYKDAGKILWDVPITPSILGIGSSGIDQWVGNYPDSYNKMYFPNGLPDYNQGKQYGQNADISHKWGIGETMENLHYTNPNAQFWAGFYDGWAPRMDQKWGAGNWRWAHDYLMIRIAPAWHEINEGQAKALFRNPSTAPGYGYVNGSLKHCNMYSIPAYLGGQDRDKLVAYNIALSGRFYKQINKYSVVYAAHDRDWRPNNKGGLVVNGDTLYLENKLPIHDSVMAQIVVSGLHFADGMAGWGGSAKVIDKKWSPYWINQFSAGSFWIKKGETQRRSWQSWPHLGEGQNYTMGMWQSNVDMCSFAAYAYAATLGQVAGGMTKAAKYKIGSGSFYNPVNTYQDDLCYAKYHQQPIVETVVANGKEAIYYQEPCSNNKRKQVTVIGQTGATHTFEVCGDMPHLGITNI